MKNRKRYLKYKEKQKKMNEYGTWLKLECQICGRDLFYYDKYDATCCIFCDVWIEPACDDPDCPYCSIRPSAPYEAVYFEDEKDDFRKDWRRQNYQHKNDGKLRHERKRALYTKNNLK